MTAFIGAAAYDAFATYIAHADLPSAVDVLDGETPFEWEVRRADRSAATIRACVALVTPTNAKKRLARADQLWKILEAASVDASDIVFPAMQTLIKAGLHITPAAVRPLERMGKYLDDANLTGRTRKFDDG